MTAIGTTRLVTIEPVNCAACGVVFGLDSEYVRSKRETGGRFRCPNGDSLSYGSELDRMKHDLKRSRDYAARLAAEKDQIEHSRRAWKGQATRARKRALEGDCPICGVHVYGLDRHVKNVHPDEPAEIVEPNA